MPKALKTVSKKKQGSAHVLKPNKTTALIGYWFNRIISPFKNFWRWIISLQPRTPHRSFRRTRKRDYIRTLELPGYIAFTLEVWRVLWRHKSTFGWLVVVYSLFSGLLLGLASQDAYTQVSESLRTATGSLLKGDAAQLGEVSSQIGVIMSGGLSTSPSESQQFLGGLMVLMAWLTTVWLLRAFLAGHTPRLRDGIYNSGAPIIPTFILGLFLVVQMIPATLAAIALSAALPTGLIDQGVESMLFWTVALLLFLLSLYWVTSTLIAMIVVTLPGVYPLEALKTANELVVGRRLRILLRLIWLLFTTLLFSALGLVYSILLDSILKSIFPAIEWLPFVPFGLLFIGSFSILWTASYIYLLYRKVVDDNAAPA
jgi:hypothetical protein